MHRTLLLILCIPLFTEIFERSVHAGKPPTVEMNTTHFSWKAGQTVILRCYVTYTDDAIDSVFWIFEHENGFKNITPSTNSDKYRGSTQSYPSLIISNLTSADVGSYKCAATNEFGTGISKTVLFLNVTGTPPNVSILRRYYNGEIRQNITLSASIYSPQSALLSVEWLFHFTGGSRQINVSASDRYMGSSMQNPSLHIVNLTSDDTGNYTCKAINWYGVGESEQIILEIKEYLPLVNIEQQNYLGNLGGSIGIKCSIALPDSEMFSVLWIFYDARNDTQVQINASSKYEIQLKSKPSLLIKNLSFSDEGLYKCLASNSFGTGYSNWTSLLIQDIPVVVIGSESYETKFGRSVTLECKVSSQTALNRIYWERNSSGNVIIISSDHAGISGASIENPGLTIKVATSYDTAWYTCVAENNFGIGKSKVSRLNVIGGIPVVTCHETVVIATYGMRVTLHVSIASSPGHFNIFWTKVMDSETTIIHDSTIGTSGGSLFNPSLTIHFPTVSDAGIYQCYATNAIGIGHSENISLIVEGDLPLVEVAEAETTAQFGDIITFNCTIRSHPNFTKVYWEKRNGDNVTTLTAGTNGIRGSTIDTPSLTIIFVTSTDSGYYTCNAENIVGVGTSRASNLKVIAGPPVVNIGSVFYTTIFGTPVTLDCFVTAEPPVRYVVWQKNVNGYLTSITHGAIGTQGVSPTWPSLTIMFPGKSDQGEYTCFAVNDLGQRGSVPTILKVSGGLPVVSIGNSVHSAKFGDSYSINCKVHSDPLHTNIYWQHKKDGLIRSITKDTPGVSGVSLDDSTLTLDFVTTSDTGFYTCFAENIVGTGSSKSVSFNVEGGVPVVDVPLIRYTAKHNQDVALVCTVNSIPQHTNVYWVKETKNGNIVLNHGTTGTIGITVVNPSLSLQPAATTDSGLYTCLASNVIGTGSSRPVSLIVTPEDEVDVSDNNQQGSDNSAWMSIVASTVGAIVGAVITLAGTFYLYRRFHVGTTVDTSTPVGNETSNMENNDTKEDNISTANETLTANTDEDNNDTSGTTMDSSITDGNETTNTEKNDTKEEHKSTVCRTNETSTPIIDKDSNDESDEPVNESQVNVFFYTENVMNMMNVMYEKIE